MPKKHNGKKLMVDRATQMCLLLRGLEREQQLGCAVMALSMLLRLHFIDRREFRTMVRLLPSMVNDSPIDPPEELRSMMQ